MARGADDGQPLAFRCDCGAIHGHLIARAVRSGTHVVCFCADCRAAGLLLNRPDPAPGPVDLFQTAPDGVHFQTGKDRLGLVRLGPNGLLRWYANCCNAPMFNTLAKPSLPFVGIHANRVDDPARLGPVRARGFVPQAGGKTRHEGAVAMIWGLASRMLAARLSGRWRDTPFFDAQGRPVAEARVLTTEERAALYP